MLTKKLNVMVVDDEPTYLETFKMVLAQLRQLKFFSLISAVKELSTYCFFVLVL